MYVHCVLTRYRKQHFAIHIYQRERLYANPAYWSLLRSQSDPKGL